MTIREEPGACFDCAAHGCRSPRLAGGDGPSGVPMLEDKLVPRATDEVLGAIYETEFLGFTHIRVKTRDCRFTVRRKTMRKRLWAKLSEVKTDLRRRITQPIPDQGVSLCVVLLGQARYDGVPGNGAALQGFRHQLGWLWGHALNRRG